jgi:putative MATE family efflux protein
MADPAPRARRAPTPPKFVHGGLLHHILVMTGTSAIGLMAIFAGDLVNMLFLGLLKDEAVIAAVGYASSIMFLTVSIGIGLSIAAAALVSPALGAGQRVKARRIAGSAHALSLAVAIVTGAMVFLATPVLLKLVGADGRALALATGYLRIQVPALPALALAMTSAAVLRSVGDARLAMFVTLGGAIINVILDPLLIFVAGLGIDGAALASALARLVMMAVGLYGVAAVHDIASLPRLRSVRRDAPGLFTVAVPAILTNVATPFANAYVTAAISHFGDGAVAGWAIVGRLMPVAFGLIYALSGSVGPIIGQNWGAGARERMRETLTLSLAVAGAFTLLAWALLAAMAPLIVRAFHAEGEAAALILLYCRWLAPLFVFLGALFVANAAFNTLRQAPVSTVLNWSRATIGTVPFVWLGGKMAGAGGVLAGNMIGGIVFGIVAVVLCYRLVARIEMASPAHAVATAVPPVSVTPIAVQQAVD